MVNQTYAAIIGDIKESRTLPNRKEVQEKFKELLETINYKYKDDIASNFMITLGDSFQGLLHRRESIFDIIFEIELGMAPIDFRFGIGIGEITTTIHRSNSMEMDGPAYHHARKMIEQIGENEKKYNRAETNIMICSGDAYKRIDIYINTILSLGTALKSKWTDRQKEVIYNYLMNNENQYKTAERMGIGQSSINKALKATNYYTYKEALIQVRLLLEEAVS